MKHTKMVLFGGWCMVLFAILFSGLSVILNEIVSTQSMVYDMERHQLFKVMAGTSLIRFILGLYSVVPLLLIPGAVSTYYIFRDNYAANMRVGMYFATTGVVALCMSLMILPSINWYLAPYIGTIQGATQEAMIVVLQAFHSYLGVFVGDILGVGCLLIWFFITSVIMMRSNHMPRPAGIIELIITALIALVLFLRYSGIAPEIHTTVSLSALMALWAFICGIGLISLRKNY